MCGFRSIPSSRLNFSAGKRCSPVGYTPGSDRADQTGELIMYWTFRSSTPAFIPTPLDHVRACAVRQDVRVPCASYAPLLPKRIITNLPLT